MSGRRPPIVINLLKVFVNLAPDDWPSCLSISTYRFVYSGEEFHGVSLIRPEVHGFPVVRVLERGHYRWSVPDVLDLLPYS